MKKKQEDKKEKLSVDYALKHPRKESKSLKLTQKSVPLIIALACVFLLGVIGVYTGMVTYHEGQGGFIYGLSIQFKQPAYNWAGIYGASFGVGITQPWQFDIEPGSMTEANVFFECFENDIEHEIYATLIEESEMNWGSLRPATFAEINSFLGVDSSDFDSAENTFSNTMSVDIGSVTINNILSTYTYVGTGTELTAFDLGVLIDDDNNLVFVAHVYETLTRGFNDRFYNYQMLLPTPGNQTITYNLFSDPNDICIGGSDTPLPRGIIQGNVTDISGNSLEEVIVVVASVSTVTNVVGFYNLTPPTGNQFIIAIKEGYKVYQNNVTIIENNVTYHNIILEIETPPNQFTDIGPDFNSNTDVGPGQDVGPGDVPFQIESPQVIEGQDYVIALNEINKKIREGEFSQDVLTILSIKPIGIQLNFEVVGNVSNLTQLDKTSLIIPARSDGRLTFTFFGNQPPGIYRGYLNITGGIDAELPITIEIIDKDRLPIQALLLGLSTSDKKLYSGSRLIFRNDLTNLLTDRAYPVQLFYSIQNLEGTETIWSSTANVFLQTALSIQKIVDLPADLREGDYVIRVTANYLDLTSSTSHVFTVSLPFWQYLLFGKVRVWQAALGLLALLAIIIAIILIRRNIESKKKYHLKVEMSELPKPGPRSIFVGKISETDHKTYMNLENFKTHTIVAGSTGGGKSFSAQVIIEEMLLKDVAVIVFDPTAQWTGMLRKLTNKGLLGLYPSFGMKPSDAKAFTGNIRQINNARELIDIKEYMKPGEIQIFAVHKLDPKDIDIFVANTVREVFHANFDESEPLRLVLVYDEVHRLLPKFGGSGEGFLQIERACREFRKWGIGVMLISQVLADFVGQIKANINTEVQMRTRDEGDLDRIKTKYGPDVLQSLVKASVGSGMVQNSAYNRGRPYFVTFKPIMHSVARLSDDEIGKYNTFNEKINQMSFELEQLEKLKQDVFDLKLELKLALDKVKAGNFNMVQIYLEGLEPRVKKIWDKLGKTPEKRVIRTVSEAELKAEMEKAKEGRQKFESENKSASPDKKEEKDDPVSRFKKDVPPDKMLKLHNDMLVINPKSLYTEIEAMKDSDFEFHVNDKKNDFADWIRNAIGDDELADNIAGAKTKQDIMKFLDMREKGQKLPKAEKKAAAAEPQKEDAKPAQQEAPPEKNQEAPKAEETQQEKTEPQKAETPAEAPVQQEVSSTPEKPQEQEEHKQEEPIPENPEPSTESVKAFDEFAKSDDEKNEGAQQHVAIEKVAASDQYFGLENGKTIKSLKELLNYIDEMPDNIFSDHVNDKKNDFASWTRGVFGEEELANKIQATKSKSELKEVLSSA